MQISINKESGSNMMTLLKTCLRSLAIILEIKLPGEISDSIKLIEEVLTYLSALINFVPKRCIICLKQTLKYMFYMNYICRAKHYEHFATNEHVFEINDSDAVLVTFDIVKKFSLFKPQNVLQSIIKQSQLQSNESKSLPSLQKLPTDKLGDLAVHIKMFEPIVLRCLKVSLLNL